jgi:glucose-1-phosphate thymidylyltransferase
MKAIILCAGYAVRLHPLTLDKPKALLEIKGRPILDYITDSLEKVKKIDEIYVISNAKFYNQFVSWKKSRKLNENIFILNDGSLCNEDRVGGIGDLLFSIKEKTINDDFIVILGDNYVNFDLNKLVSFFDLKKGFSIGLCNINNFEEAKKFGVIKIWNGEIISFVEKPKNPESTLVSTGIYIFSKENIPEIEKYIHEHGPRGGPGYLIDFLRKKEKVYGLELNGFWYDIGSIETYNKVNLD